MLINFGKNNPAGRGRGSDGIRNTEAGFTTGRGAETQTHEL